MKTQKAKGLVELRRLNVFTVPHFIVRDTPPLPGAPIAYPIMARPAPRQPRHGFVESRVVHSANELRKVFAETLQADPEGEVILMQPIQAAHSAIWAPGRLAIGRGNDGATSGKDSISLPVVNMAPFPAGVTLETITQAPYLEMVFNKAGFPFGVQLRDGPIVPDGDDFIPKTTQVDHILMAVPGTSLLDWEKLVRDQPPGTVANHPGGNLVSHFAVHCVAVGMPIVCSRPIKIGEVLKPTVKTRPPDTKSFLRGVAFGLRIAAPETVSRLPRIMAHCGELVFAIARNMARYDMSRAVDARVFGAACGLAARLSFMCACGESRFAKDFTKSPIIPKGPRFEIFAEAWNDQAAMETMTLNALALFDAPSAWPSGGFGGPRWAKATRAAITLYNLAVAGKVKDCMTQLNRVITSVHNSGWLWNKFMDGSVPQESVDQPTQFTIRKAPALYELAVASAAMVPEDGKPWSMSDPVKRTLVAAQWRPLTSTRLRLQVRFSDGGTSERDISVPERLLEKYKPSLSRPSWAKGSDKLYCGVTFTANGAICVGATEIAHASDFEEPTDEEPTDE